MNYMSEVLRQGLGQWSPNGRYLAGAQQNRLQIRDPEFLKLLQVFICIDKVERIEWSPDSQLLLTELSRQGVIQIWSPRRCGHHASVSKYHPIRKHII